MAAQDVSNAAAATAHAALCATREKLACRKGMALGFLVVLAGTGCYVALMTLPVG